MEASRKIFVYDVLMVECFNDIWVCEGIITLELVVVSLCDTRDSIRLIDEPSCPIIGDDDFGSSTEIGKDVRFPLLRVLRFLSTVADPSSGQ